MDLSFGLRKRESVSSSWAFFVISCQEYVMVGVGTDPLQLALTTLTAYGKRKGSKMERSPAVEVEGQS